MADNIFQTLDEPEDPTSFLLDKAISILDQDVFQQAIAPIDLETEALLTTPSAIPGTDVLTPLLSTALQSEAPNLFVGSLARRLPEAAFRESQAAQAKTRAGLREEQRRQAELQRQAAVSTAQIARTGSDIASQELARQRTRQLLPSEVESARAKASLDKQKADNYQAEFNIDKNKANAYINQVNQSVEESRSRIRTATDKQEEEARQATQARVAVGVARNGIAELRKKESYINASPQGRRVQEFDTLSSISARLYQKGNSVAPTAIDDLLLTPIIEVSKIEDKSGAPSTLTGSRQSF